MVDPHIPLERVRVALPEVLKVALAPLISQCTAQGIELRLIADADLPPVAVDRDKIAWALTTLVGNALRYLPQATTSEVGGDILVHVERTTGGLAVAVQDDGPGIPDDRLERLLARPDGTAPATALALLLVRDIVGAHGGSMDVRSQCGTEEHFTCVTLFLPSAP